MSKEEIRRKSEEMRKKGIPAERRYYELREEYPDVPDLYLIILEKTGECNGCFYEPKKYEPIQCKICIRNPNYRPAEELIKEGKLKPLLHPKARYTPDQYAEMTA